MASELISLIEKKRAGRPYDYERYALSIAEIVERVYMDRCPNIPIQRFADVLSGKAEPEFAERAERYGYVDYLEFFNACIDKLENGDLLFKSSSNSFKKCSELTAYLYKSFLNLLQNMIDDLIPGLESRKKQVKKILKHHCLEVKYKGQSCWQLRNTENKNIVPADFENLKEVVKGLVVPELIYPKKKDAKKGPQIKFKAMEKFLIELFRRAGGMIEWNALVALIRNLYDLNPVGRYNSQQGDEEERADQEATLDYWVSVLEKEGLRLPIGNDHFLMAEEIFHRMDDSAKEVYYYYHGENIKFQPIARRLKISIGKAHGLYKKAMDCIEEYFASTDQNPSIEEMSAVVALLKVMIEAERASHEKKTP